MTVCVRSMEPERSEVQFEQFCSSAKPVEDDGNFENSFVARLLINCRSGYRDMIRIKPERQQQISDSQIENFISEVLEITRNNFANQPTTCLELLSTLKHNFDKDQRKITIRFRRVLQLVIALCQVYDLIIPGQTGAVERCKKVLANVQLMTDWDDLGIVVVKSVYYLLGDQSWLMAFEPPNDWYVYYIARTIDLDQSINDLAVRLKRFLCSSWQVDIDQDFILQTGMMCFLRPVNYDIKARGSLEENTSRFMSFRVNLSKSETDKQSFIEKYGSEAYDRISEGFLWGLLVIVADHSFKADDQWVSFYTDVGDQEQLSTLEKELIFPSHIEFKGFIKIEAYHTLSPLGCVYRVLATPASKEELLLIINKFSSSCLFQYCEVVFGGHGEMGSGDWILQEGTVQYEDVIPLLRKSSLLYLNCCYSHIWQTKYSESFPDKFNIIKAASSDAYPEIPFVLLPGDHPFIVLTRTRKYMEKLWYKELVQNKATILKMAGSLPGADSVWYPRGFKSFNDFVRCLKPLIDWLHKKDSKASIVIHGSSIMGYRYTKKDGRPYWFDKDSDYDVALCSGVLFTAAVAQQIDLRESDSTRPLSRQDELCKEMDRILSNTVSGLYNAHTKCVGLIVCINFLKFLYSHGLE